MEFYKKDIEEINKAFDALDKCVVAVGDAVAPNVIIEVVSENTIIGTVGHFDEESPASFRGKY